MRDERILLRFRPRGICGAVYFSHTSCIRIFLNELDTEIFNPIDYRNYANSTKLELEANRVYESSEG